MEFLVWSLGNSPLLHAGSMFAFVMVTLVLTCLMSLLTRGKGAWGWAILAVVAADLVFTFGFVAIHGVHSTIGIGTFFLLFVGAAVVAPVAATLQAVRWLTARELRTARD